MDRINTLRALIIQYETCLGAFARGDSTYSLDTGQSRQTVTRHQLGSVQITLNRLHQQLDAYQQRLCGRVTYMGPSW
jgi:Mg2+ and Co2+ transporter CorA